MKLVEEKKLVLPAHVSGLVTGREGMLLAACYDGGIYEVDVESGERRELARHGSYASGVVWNAGLGRAVSSGYDGKLKWIDVENGVVEREVGAHDFWSWQSALSPDGALVASVTGQYLVGGYKYEPAAEREPSVKVFDMASGELRRSFPHVPPVESVAFSRDGRFLAAGNLMGEVRVWEVATGEEVARIETGSFTGWGIIKGHYYTGGVFSLAFAPGDGEIVLAGMGSTRDPAAGNGKQLWERFSLGEEGGVKKVASALDGEIGEGLMESLTYHPSDRFFVMAGRLFKGSWNAAVFDAESGGRVHSLDAKMRVSKAVFDAGGERLFLGGGGSQKVEDGTVPDWGRVKVFRVEEV
ncbi:MAG: WD40 repeat domain-containing protein [Verrucomicrobiales bacterium]|nr:WD40 repeat domain-containing protein [Verrucomicrobiales bacterium]